MTLSSALVVDEIKKHPDGRVDLLGLFEDLYFESIPIILENLSLFLDIELATEDRGKRHALQFTLIGPDGAPTSDPWNIKFAVPGLSEYPRNAVQLDPTLFSLTFPRFGPYAIEIHHVESGALLRRIPLHVHANPE